MTPTTVVAWLPDRYAMPSHAVLKPKLGDRYVETLCEQVVELDGRRTHGRQVGEVEGLCGECCQAVDTIIERSRAG